MTGLRKNRGQGTDKVTCPSCGRTRFRYQMHSTKRCRACYKQDYYNDPVHGAERREKRYEKHRDYLAHVELTLVEIDE